MSTDELWFVAAVIAIAAVLTSPFAQITSAQAEQKVVLTKVCMALNSVGRADENPVCRSTLAY
jgi:hypothetical protein